MTAQRHCIVLLLDPAGRQGHAAAAEPIDAGRLRAALQALWPDHEVFVQLWSAEPGGRRDASAAFTDVRRLADLPLGQGSRVVVMRPGALLLPDDALHDLLRQADERDLDLAVLGGMPSELCYVVSHSTLELLTSISDVPGAVSVPQAVERLGAAARTPLSTTRVTPKDVGWLRLAAAVSPATWRATPKEAWLDLPSPDRLAAVVAAQQASFADAHASVMHHRPRRRDARSPGETGRVLVVVPSMFQTGAHSAWAELAPVLSPAHVAFVVGRGTALADVLRHAGFAVHEVREGLVPGSGTDVAVLLDAFEASGAAIVHLDGAEANTWAGMLHARGARVVVHVRLNDAERFRPSFLFADAIVGVSEPLCAGIGLRVGAAVRVAHIPDGVRAMSDGDAASPMTRSIVGAEGTELLCLCVGRVEPAKDQLRVLDVFNALAHRVACRLVIIGPCGSDAAYCDEVRRRISHRDDVEWQPFSFPLTDLYRQAHVVLVGSRNEALGMVGLETLAAGGLLVAHRSTGYERIIDPAQREGVLFERDDLPEVVAGRIIAALDDFDTYSANARRKAADHFDAALCAERLSRLWQEVAPSPV